jgi:hypothetical protein
MIARSCCTTRSKSGNAGWKRVITSFIIHYLDRQPRKKILGPFFVMATIRSGDLLLKGILGPCGVFGE